MNRRRFLLAGAAGVAGAWVGSKVFSPTFAAPPPLAQKVAASDVVILGKTGIRTSRLAMGTGTVGSGHHCNQTALGLKGLSDLLLNGYDHGLRFFDSADAYGSHPHVAEALKHVPRDKVTVLTKTWARDPQTARADLDRFRRELGTDTIDICLMHCLTEGDWTERYQGVMDVLSEAKKKESSGRMAAPAIPSKPCAPRRSLPGSKSIWPASIRSVPTWMARPTSRCCAEGNEGVGKGSDRNEDPRPGRPSRTQSTTLFAMRCLWECSTHSRSVRKAGRSRKI